MADEEEQPERPGRAFQQKTVLHRESLEEQSPTGGASRRSTSSTATLRSSASPLPRSAPAKTRAPTSSPLWAAGARVRSFGATPLTLLELSRLLWASAGVTASFITPHGQDFYRAAPTAGALYPIETYVVVNKVEGLEPGLYHYRVAGLDILERPIVEGSHSLEQLRTGDLRAEITAAALDQPLCGKAGSRLRLDAVFARSEWKYRERSYRYFYLDAGHMAAQLSLAAVAQGLGSCPMAAFYDDELNALLGIDGQTEGSST